MKFSTFVSSAVLAIVASVAYASVDMEDGVYVLGDDTFADFVKENEFVLAEFYAPWCGHCKSLAPEYAAAAKELADAESSIKLAKVDATVHPKVSQEFDVKGYPTLKFFRSGNAMDYAGGRTKADIVSWLNKKTGPPAETLDTVEKLNKAQEAMEVIVVGVFDDVESVAAKAFLAVAAGMDDISFGITSDADVRAELKAEGDSVILLKKFDEGRSIYEGEFEETSITEFIVGNSIPLVMEFNQQNQPKIFGGPLKTHMLLFTTDAQFADVKECYEKAAAKYRGKAIFITVDTAADSSQQVMQYFQIEKDSDLALRLINMDSDMVKFIPESPITCDTFDSFVGSFIDGKLKPHLNSESVPDGWDSEPVKVLVGENFHSVALDESKDVFVEFYAPWCGHCKSLAPIWDELAEKYEDNENVVIAKMDSTANEVTEVTIKGFPTLKFFPANSDGKIVDYEGGRTLDALKAWLDEHITTGSAKPDAEVEPEEAEGSHEEL
eukprot:CFRG1840T1